MMTEEHGMPPVDRSPVTPRSPPFSPSCCAAACRSSLIVLGLRRSAAASTLAMTSATFFAIGSLRSRWSPTPWWRAGLETLAIGMAAAGVAYLVGDLLQGLV